MLTTSPHDVADLDEQHFERWRRLHDERRFRVEQLDALAAEPACGPRHESVNLALRIAAMATLREIDAALERMDQGRYGLCVTCSQPLPDNRLDTLPMAPLCMSCHYNEQKSRLARRADMTPNGTPSSLLNQLQDHGTAPHAQDSSARPGLLSTRESATSQSGDVV